MNFENYVSGEISWRDYVRATGHSPNCISQRNMGFTTCDCGGPHVIAAAKPLEDRERWLGSGPQGAD